MKREESFSDFLFYIVIGTLYTFSVASALVAASIFDVQPSVILISAFVSLMFFYFMFYNEYSFAVMSGIFLITVVIIYIYLKSKGFQVEWFIKLKDSFGEILLFVLDLVPYEDSYSTFLGIGATIMVSVVTVLNLHNHFGFYTLTFFAMGVFAIPVINRWERSTVGELIFVFCFIALAIRKFTSYSINDSQETISLPKNYFFTLVPLAIVIFVVSLSLPKPGASSLDIASLIEDTTQQTMRNVSQFESKGELGGPNAFGDHPVMEVESDERVYLRGAVYDTYTGRSWLSSDKTAKDLPTDENNIILTSEYSGTKKQYQDYLMRYYGWGDKSITITPEEGYNKRIFTPTFQRSFSSDENVELVSNESGQIWAKRAMPVPSSYTQEYLGWNYTSEYFSRMLINSPKTDNSNGELDRYLSLPDSIPSRVHDLAAELTASYSDDFSKIKSLENYLAQFPYTLTPDYTPQGDDFVDNFLFEEKQGYCVYYATALAVMGRSVGIPTRYVEGFVLPSEKNPEGNYMVTGKQAHAWVEVLFPDVGWVHFEATAPNNIQLYGDSPASDELADPEQSPDITLDDEQQLTDPDEAPPIIFDEQADFDEDIPPENEDTEIKEKKGVPTFVKVFFIILVVVGLGYLVFYLNRKRFEKISELPNKDATIAYYNYMLKVSEALGYPINANETAIEYAERVGADIDLSPASTNMQELAELFFKAVYSDNEISETEKQSMKEAYDLLLEKLKKNISPKDVILSRVILHS